MDAALPSDVVKAGLQQPSMWITQDADSMRLERQKVGGWTEARIEAHQTSMRGVRRPARRRLLRARARDVSRQLHRHCKVHSSGRPAGALSANQWISGALPALFIAQEISTPKCFLN